MKLNRLTASALAATLLAGGFAFHAFAASDAGEEKAAEEKAALESAEKEKAAEAKEKEAAEAKALVDAPAEATRAMGGLVAADIDRDAARAEAIDRRAQVLDALEAKGALEAADMAEGWERPTPHSGMALTFGTMVFEYGEVDEGVMVAAEFPFVNTSDRVVTITNIRSSCGCTAAQLAKREYAPGEGEVIRANFNTSGRSGHQRTTVTVTTDDPANPIYRLDIDGRVARRLFFDERLLNFGDIEEGEGGTVVFNLVNLTGQPVSIQSATAQDATITITAGDPIPWSNPAANESGEAIPLTVEIPADRGIGNITGSISVRVMSEGTSRNLVASMRGRVVGDVMTQPPLVSYGVVEPGDTREITLDVTVRGNRPFEMTGWRFESLRAATTANTEDIAVDARLQDNPRLEGRQQIVVSMDAPAEGRGAYRGNLIVEGQVDGRATTMTLPLTAVVRSSGPGQIAPAAAADASGLRRADVIPSAPVERVAPAQPAASAEREAALARLRAQRGGGEAPAKEADGGEDSSKD